MFKQFSVIYIFFAGLFYLQAFPAIADNSISFNSSAISPPIALTPNTALPNTIIGALTVKSDSVNGFTISAESTNGGALKRSSGEAIAYTLTYNGIDQGQLTAKKVVENVSNLITDCASQNGCNRQIQIAISQTAISAKPAGSYSDLLLFTLVTK
ncbi:hypothetical protein V2H45_10120 [Tumidithrix elongata RA019]|uniref:Uncharacterized protein n=1 Tax=Tumidithrix elongata BACA0141 TaxID=2716417 RepID=A0AAW9PW91_9CYAN|nr:hypothetical protein [Tumidithrix elongata RA019]